MTNDEILIEVIGKKSGYFWGQGEPSLKGTFAAINVHKIWEEIWNEMELNIENMVKEQLVEG